VEDGQDDANLEEEPPRWTVDAAAVLYDLSPFLDQPLYPSDGLITVVADQKTMVDVPSGLAHEAKIWVDIRLLAVDDSC
jgi:hypothetical protein